MTRKARSPAIRGRPAPQRKQKSSSATTASSAAASLLPTRTPITKALKRAQKRASLLQKTGVISSDNTLDNDDEHQSARALLQHGGTLSKSALRRRKRKERDELAKDVTQGRQGGVKDLTDAVEELEEEIMEADEESSGHLQARKGGRITANQRKRVLYVQDRRLL